MRTVQNLIKARATAALLFIIGIVISGRAWAQDKGVKIDINTHNSPAPWYGVWWVWVIGVGVFALILVAIVSAGKKT